MKRYVILMLCAALLTGCGTSSIKKESVPVTQEESQRHEITLAMFPVGDLGKTQTLSSMVAEFNNKHDDIEVKVEMLDYQTGDKVLEEMLEDGRVDIVFEGPQRIVADYGVRGILAPLDDLWNEHSEDISGKISSACKIDDTYYEYPVCVTAHVMAVNKDIFDEVGLSDYIDDSTRTWTTENFLMCVQKLHDAGYRDAVKIYCKSQGGDQGTRVLVTNMYGGTFTNEEHTAYTVDTEENRKALNDLYNTPGVVFDGNADGGQVIDEFCAGEQPITLCWNVASEISKTVSGDINFDVYPVSFPTVDGLPARLDSGIYGFGVVNTTDARVSASKEFIRHIVYNDSVYKRFVELSTFWPVFEVQDMYVNDVIMNEYGLFTNYIGDHYQVADNWTAARSAWWKMLQKVEEGENVDSATAWFQSEVASSE